MTRLCVVVGAHWAAQMGGAQYQVKCLLEAIGDRPDFDTTYVSRRTPTNFKPEGYRIIQIGSPGRKRGVAGVLSDILPLYKVLARQRPSVVYQRGLTAYTGVCALYCARHRARLVFHASRDGDVHRPAYKKLSPYTPVRWLERKIAEYGLRRAEAIVVQTKSQARMLTAEYGLTATLVVPNFHPLPLEHSNRADHARFRVSWVANFKPIKNPEIFVDLAASFAGNSEIEFIMIGRPGNLRQYSQLHERIRLLENLEYLGESPIEQVDEQVACSDVLVNTSTAEGFSNTFIQAWLRGVPVVSCWVDPDGCLSRGGAGVLAGGVEGLASVIGNLLKDRSRLRELGEAARNYGYANHGMDRAGALVELLAYHNSAINEENLESVG